jgi:ABC-type dipeptide/oligopeptide/nickel transport system permease subunit
MSSRLESLPAVSAPALHAADETTFQMFIREFKSSSLAVAASVVLTLLVFAALFAPWIAPQNPYDLAQLNLADSQLPPGSQSMDGLRDDVAFIPLLMLKNIDAMRTHIVYQSRLDARIMAAEIKPAPGSQ